MMGTLARFLAEKDIPTPEDRYQAHVEGDIEDIDGVLKITRIRVNYGLKVPPGKTELPGRPERHRLHPHRARSKGRGGKGFMKILVPTGP